MEYKYLILIAAVLFIWFIFYRKSGYTSGSSTFPEGKTRDEVLQIYDQKKTELLTKYTSLVSAAQTASEKNTISLQAEEELQALTNEMNTWAENHNVPTA